jgi:hypothetical protein
MIAACEVPILPAPMSPMATGAAGSTVMVDQLSVWVQLERASN